MSREPISQNWALKLQLALIAGDEPPRSYFELRGLKDGRIAAREFVPICCPKRTRRRIGELCATMDVYIGCAPRVSNTSGTLKDVERVWALWCDCDSAEATERLRRFKPWPSIVVQSSPGRVHGYWSLNEPLRTDVADRANRRIMRALGSDGVCDAARVLRPIGTINHKHGASVECVRLELDTFTLADVVGDLEDDNRYRPKPRVPFQQRRRHTSTGGLVAAVANAQEGSRNRILYWAGRRASDEGTLHEVRDDLADAAVASGLDWRSAQATLASAERAA